MCQFRDGSIDQPFFLQVFLVSYNSYLKSRNLKVIYIFPLFSFTFIHVQ